uniref:hAT-like transposase RNase-H fold domain-containing protein n=1 Tax=Chenopodium quinoa TaxID=63459 RepID=A0A803M6L9_CHEQI
MDADVQQLSSEEEEIDSTTQDKGNGKNQKTSSGKPRVILTGKKRQRRLSSGVWVNFYFLDEPDENGNLICKCKKCGIHFNADRKNGTGNLHRHLKNCKQRSFRDVGQMILEKTSSGLGNRLREFDANYFRELLSLAIVEHDMPFQFVEFKEFSTFMAVAVVLDPRYKLQCVNWGYMRIYGQHSVEYELEFSKVKDALRSLYEAYASSHSSSSNVIPTANASNANDASDDFMMDFDSFSMEQSNVAIKSEVDISALKSETVETIICLRDWDFGEDNMDPQMAMLRRSVMKLKVGDNDDAPQTSPELLEFDENASSNIV